MCDGYSTFYRLIALFQYSSRHCLRAKQIILGNLDPTLQKDDGTFNIIVRMTQPSLMNLSIRTSFGGDQNTRGRWQTRCWIRREEAPNLLGRNPGSKSTVVAARMSDQTRLGVAINLSHIPDQKGQTSRTLGGVQTAADQAANGAATDNHHVIHEGIDCVRFQQ